MNSLPPAWSTATFNSNAFQGVNYLTRQQADLLYLTISAGANLGLIDGITPGTATASKALVVDASRNITNIGFLTASSILATSVIIGGATLSNTQANYLTSITPGTAAASKALVLDSSRNISNVNVFTASEVDIAANIRLLTSGGVNYIQSGLALSAGSSADLFIGNALNTYNGSTRALMMKGGTGKVAIQGYNPTKQLDINSATGDCLRLMYNSNFDGTGVNYSDFNVSSGGNLTISSTGLLTSIGVTNSFDIAGHNGTTLGLKLAGTLVTSTATELNFNAGVTLGTVTASKTMTVDSSRNITNIGTMSQTVAAGGDMLTLISSATTARNSIKFTTDNQNWEVGSRGSTAANPTSFYVYNGAYKLVMLPSGNTTLNGQLTLSTSTSHLNIVNGAQNALIEVPSSPDMLRLVRGYAVNIGTSGVNIGSASTRNPICPLDMGQTVNNMGISLYNDGTSYYGFSANNSATQYSSGGAHRWYTTCSTASPININTMSLESTGNLTILNNTFAKSYFATGFSSTGLTGSGTKIHWSGTIGEIFAYDYSGAVYKDLKLGNGLYIAGPSGYCGIGTTSVSFPFVVLSSISSSIAGSYGYLSDTGAGTGSGTGSVAVSAYFAERIFAKEIDCFSDERLKHNIVPINEDDAINFIKNVIPIEYEWRDEHGGKRTGYSAQQLLKTGLFPDLVTSHINPDMKGETDADGFVSPEGRHFAIQYSNVVSILHKVIQKQQRLINKLYRHLNIEQD